MTDKGNATITVKDPSAAGQPTLFTKTYTKTTVNER
jgi:hypothetical protein